MARVHNSRRVGSTAFTPSAELTGKSVRHILPPSYHGGRFQRDKDYLVFHEFGTDIEHVIRSSGFLLEIVRHHQNPAVATFVTRPD